MPYAGSATAHRDDRGLAAVARVREVAEQRSLLELRHALAARDACRTELERLQQQLSAGASLEAAILDRTPDPGTLLTLRMGLGQLAETSRGARLQLDQAESALDAARERWEADHGRLAAVAQRLERRRAERAVEARRPDAPKTQETAAPRGRRRTTRTPP